MVVRIRLSPSRITVTSRVSGIRPSAGTVMGCMVSVINAAVSSGSASGGIVRSVPGMLKVSVKVTEGESFSNSVSISFVPPWYSSTLFSVLFSTSTSTISALPAGGASGVEMSTSSVPTLRSGPEVSSTATLSPPSASAAATVIGIHKHKTKYSAAMASAAGAFLHMNRSIRDSIICITSLSSKMGLCLLVFEG